MKIFNNSLNILTVFCFCVLSISTNANHLRKQNSISVGTSSVDVSYTKPSSPTAQDATITISVIGKCKVIAVSNTNLGTFTKEGEGKIVLNQLFAGFYKLYITDSNNVTTEYQVTID